MRNNKRVRRISLAVLAALLFTSVGVFSSCIRRPLPPTETSPTPCIPNQAAVISEAAKPFYYNGEKSEITLAFFDGISDLPMISVNTAAELLSRHVQAKKDASYTLEAKTEGDVITLTRDNAAYCVFDFEKGTLFFDEYNRFHTFSYELGALDILDSNGFNEQGEAEYFQRVMCSETAGKSSLIDLLGRGIPMTMQNGKGYLTLQTFSDLFLTPYEVMLVYHDAGAFFLDGNLLGDLEATYYGTKSEGRSEELIDLTYRQLCLTLDFHYGLSEEHGFDSADAYITQIGLKDDFYGDPETAFSALKTLVYKYFADNHSSVLMHSPYLAEPNYSIGADEASIGYWEFYRNYQQYNAYRAEQVNNGLQSYTEIGDTAFVVFNSFASATVDYYENSPLDGAYYDEIGLICYAHAQINRENSPIKNVVIDLGTNTGGHMDGGIFLVGWAFGNALMHISDPVRGGTSTCMYRADVNLDRKFDAQDTLQGKNVYLLTSPITFSCANYVASAFREAGTATIIGTTTGGGASCVYMASTADGAAFCFSSGLCMSSYKNGSYYKIDTGIAPDVKLADVKSIFNYQKIADIIKTLH